MRKWLIAIVVLFMAVGCVSDPPPRPVPPNPDGEVEQTTIMYLCGTTLRYYLQQNIRDAMSVITPATLSENQRVMVYFETGRRNEAAILELYYSPQTGRCEADTVRVFKDTEGLNSMKAKTMADVLTTITTHAPAQKYSLIMGGHGQGWVPGDVSLSRMRTNGSAAPPIETRLDITLQAFGDRKTDLSEMIRAFELAEFRPEWILFDACFMSNVEVLYQLRHITDRIVASPCEILGAGFPYKTAFPPLLKNDPEGACEAFLYHYENYTQTGAEVPSGCITLTDCRELDALATLMKKIEATASPILPGKLETIQIYEGFSNHVFYDLQEYAEAVCSDDLLLDALQARLDKTFPVKLHTPWFYSAFGGDGTWNGSQYWGSKMTYIDHYSGVSTSAPAEQLRTQWLATEWAKAME